MNEEMVMSVGNWKSSKQMRKNYGARDNLLLVSVLHMMWMRSPASIRAQASRTLSLYQELLIVLDGWEHFLKQRSASTGLIAHCIIRWSKEWKTWPNWSKSWGLRRALSTTNQCNSFLLLAELKETVKRTHNMVEEMYEKIMEKPKRQRVPNQLQFDAQEDEEIVGQIWLFVSVWNEWKTVSYGMYNQCFHYKTMNKWVFFNMIE